MPTSPGFPSQWIVSVVTALALLATTSAFAQDPKIKPDSEGSESNPEKQRVVIELKKMKAGQRSKVSAIESKLLAAADRLDIILDIDLSKVRAIMRELVEEQMASKNDLRYARIAKLQSQIERSLTGQSEVYSGFLGKSMKDTNPAMRLNKQKFLNLRRQHLIESIELERLNLLEEWIRNGKPVTMKMLPKPIITEGRGDTDNKNMGKAVFN
jgi:hypothetical protein